MHTIVTDLSALTTLNLSSNFLQGAEELEHLPKCTGMQVLVVNDCKLTWPDLLCLGHCMPCLTELYAGDNGIASLEAEPDSRAAVHAAFGKLQVLDLMSNSLDSWAAVQPLAQLPGLTQLKLSENPLSHVGIQGLHPAACRTPYLARFVKRETFAF